MWVTYNLLRAIYDCFLIDALLDDVQHKVIEFIWRYLLISVLVDLSEYLIPVYSLLTLV